MVGNTEKMRGCRAAAGSFLAKFETSLAGGGDERAEQQKKPAGGRLWSVVIVPRTTDRYQHHVATKSSQKHSFFHDEKQRSRDEQTKYHHHVFLGRLIGQQFNWFDTGLLAGYFLIICIGAPTFLKMNAKGNNM